MRYREIKISIIYFSASGNTEKIAQSVAAGAKSVLKSEVRLFNLDSIDYNFLKESKVVIFGTPTYYANTCWQIKKWFDESWNCNLEGKLGAVFATSDYIQGGADIAVLAIIEHLLVKGMLVYSGGSALGEPYLHIGAITLKKDIKENNKMFEIFGKRIVEKAASIFNC